VVGWNLDDAHEPESGRLDGGPYVVRRHSQFHLRAARLPQDRGLFSRLLMPVHNRELSAGREYFRNAMTQPRSVRHAVEGVGEEDKADRLGDDLGEIARVSDDERAIVEPRFGDAALRDVRSARSMSMAMTRRATFAMGNVNQPLPAHRSIAVTPGVSPDSLSTCAGGISVP
jgi:hypothetical protein